MPMLILLFVSRYIHIRMLAASTRLLPPSLSPGKTNIKLPSFSDCYGSVNNSYPISSKRLGSGGAVHNENRSFTIKLQWVDVTWMLCTSVYIIGLLLFLWCRSKEFLMVHKQNTFTLVVIAFLKRLGQHNGGDRS